ncbi:RNA polymerase sigma factor [Fusobacterium polymorphum]|uniref:RNA polymerase sigma factor n=1 Tax=Fusobacterium nucleatum subsp. polymorphum TaxID=76857 RepID=UPI003008532A
MKKEEIYKIIDERVETKIKDLKNINNLKSPYRKVEVILKNYKNFQKMVVSLKEQLNNIEIVKKINPDSTKPVGYVDYKPDIEKKEDIKDKINEEILIYENRILKTENALDFIKNDKYYRIIELKYFENYSVEDVCEKLDITEKTYRSHRNRLIDSLTLYLFPKEILEDF